MPKFTHTVSTNYTPSFRTQAVAGMFDVPVEEKLTRTWDVDLPIEDFDWEVGLIVGPSGCGKTTLARKIFGEKHYFDGKQGFDWNPDRSLLDDFDESLSSKQIVGALSQVGFSSPPAWMLPFDKLSNGQKFRAEMARLVLETDELAVVDEFTSVVDRQVAKVCSFAVQKLVRKSKKRLVAVSCHDDITEWLEPDWVYRVDTGEFRRGRLRRPAINITLRRVHYSAWELFKGHHYLSRDLAIAAHCFVAFMGDTPVAFAAALNQPLSGKNQVATGERMWRGHRTVVLPDYQGIGLGNMISEAVAQHFVDLGARYVSTTSHPAMIAHRTRSSLWKLRRKPGRVSKIGDKGQFRGTESTARLTASFEFVGQRSGQPAQKD